MKKYNQIIDEKRESLEGWDFDIEQLKKSVKPRQYRSTQGRPPRQYESNMKATVISLIGLGLCFLYIILFG